MREYLPQENIKPQASRCQPAVSTRSEDLRGGCWWNFLSYRPRGRLEADDHRLFADVVADDINIARFMSEPVRSQLAMRQPIDRVNAVAGLQILHSIPRVRTVARSNSVSDTSFSEPEGVTSTMDSITCVIATMSLRMAPACIPCSSIARDFGTANTISEDSMSVSISRAKTTKPVY
jgi:hypothetical protein